jgi:hypothetical protein
MLLALPYLRISFDAELDGRDIPLFRGAVVHSVGYHHTLFHNHTEEGFRYAYPLIQYKRVGGKPSIICVGEGTQEISHLFQAGKPYDLRIGHRQMPMSIERLDARKHLLQLWDAPIRFQIRRWLPFNSESYAAYRTKTTDAEQRELLEAILRGQIMAFAKGVAWELPPKEERPVVCKILHLSEPMRYAVRDARLIGFDATFETNTSLPNLIGLGRHVSIGYGVVTQVKGKED